MFFGTPCAGGLAPGFVIYAARTASHPLRTFNDTPQHGRGTPAAQVQKLLQRFLQRVDRETRPLQLNLFKRAKLANTFKWRLLEKGIELQIVDELTQALYSRRSSLLTWTENFE